MSAAIATAIASPTIASLLSTHPNDALDGHAFSWWSWAQHRPQAWLQLTRYYRDGDGVVHDVPQELRSLVDTVRSLQLQRDPAAFDTRSVGDRAYRISPKKEHEVDRMCSYVHHLLGPERSRSVWHAVDVGSGRGYLSRALQELDLDVLALDNDENQTSGASRWTTKEAARKLKKERRTNLEGVRKPAQKSSAHPTAGQKEREDPRSRHSDSHARKGSLAHQTVHVCPRTLEEAVAEWLSNHPAIVHSPPEPVPVMLVALHACGSLTVDVLRTFLSNRAHAVGRAWRCHSLVVVGCCYNLMSPSDFPLSKSLRDLDPPPKLPIAATHLAAQVPSQWLKDEHATRHAELALRKVAYRALLQPLLQSTVLGDDATPPERPIQPGLGETYHNRRLGKLNDNAYRDWPTFLDCATEKLGINRTAISASLPGWFTDEEARLKMESALFVLQTLRCILGPLIETLILLDRRNWIEHELAEMNDRGEEVEVEMVNLFDQVTGSGRNVALVIKPATIPQRLACDGTNLGTRGA